MLAPADPALDAALAPLVGRDPTWHPLTHPRGAHQVWRVTGPRAAAIVKRHASARPFAQERHAYVAWRPHLPEETPTLLAEFPATRTLVLTAVAGAPLADHAPVAVCEAHWHAGRFLRALHAIPHADPDPLPLADAVARRHAAWLARLARLLPAADLARLRALADAIPAAFAAAARVPCHRDFDERNWLVRGTHAHVTALAVIDFEHARLDDPIADLAKLAAAWPAHPDRADAFLAGYGRDLAPRERARLRHHLALHAMATLAWAHTHRDPTFLAAGTAALAALA